MVRHIPLVRTLTYFVLCAALSSCTPEFLSINDLHHLHKGMDRKRVLRDLPMQPGGGSGVFVGQRLYTFDYYPLQTAQKVERTTEIDHIRKTRREVLTTTVYTNRFYFLYDQGSLMYWGMLGDFSKAEDPVIAEIAQSMYTIATVAR